MNEDQNNKQPGTGEAWRDVAKQFELLGVSLADAFRASLQSEENRRRAVEMRKGLEAMVQEVNRAINESVTSPQAQQARSEAGKTAQTVRAAGGQTLQEIRMQLVGALRTVNDELAKMTHKMESEKPSGENQPPSDQPKS